MRRPVLLAAALLAAGLPVAASAEPQPGPVEPCHAFYSNGPLVGGPGRFDAVVHGGPVAAVETGGPATARLVCSIQLGAYEHAAPDVVSVPGPAALVAVVASTSVSWEGEITDLIVVCSHVEVEGGPVYYFDGVASTWSTDPGTPCAGPA